MSWEEFRRGDWQCQAPCTKPQATMSGLSPHVLLRLQGGSSKALTASIYGHRESRPREEQCRSPFPRFPQFKGPSQRLLSSTFDLGLGSFEV